MRRRLFSGHIGRHFSALAAVMVAASAAAAPGERFDGVWLIEKPVFELRTADGKAPPFKPEAAKIFREHAAARKRGDTSFDSATWCASVGLPRLVLIPRPFEIVTAPERVVFLHQWDWWSRIAYVRDKMPQEPSPPPRPGVAEEAPSTYVLPGPTGSGLARWEGDTLVIETGQFLDTTLLDSAGTPHSDALKLTERLRLTSEDVLEDVIRIDDPETFVRPWNLRVTYRRQPAGTRIMEDVCLDRIRDGGRAVEE